MWWRTLIELSVLGIWVIIVGRAYLNFDLHAWPVGGEYGLSIQSYFTWPIVHQCGVCFLWNGSVNGGSPTLAEMQGAVAHPLVAISSLLLGAINGSKLVLLGSLAMAGFAQWWLARVLGLGSVASVWSAALAVVGGHLAGRMANGVVNIVLSTAACSLILAPLLKLLLTGQRRATLQLAVVGALAILAGQGYLQIGAALSFLPAALVLIVARPGRPQHLGREFLLAGVLALLLASVFLIPMAHFWPNFAKDVDVTLGSSQPLEYIPFNFVIRDPAFFPLPYLYINYIGWVPILLAACALRAQSAVSRRVLVFLATVIGLSLFISSAVPLRWLLNLAPQIIAAIRFPSFIAGLAVPALLALAAIGLDQLIVPVRSNPTDAPTTRDNRVGKQRLSLKWLALGVPLIWSLSSAQMFGEPWLSLSPESKDVTQAMSTLKPSTAEWVGFPIGEGFWTAGALDAGLKLSPTFRPWFWKDRESPPPHYDGQRDKTIANAADFVSVRDGVYWQEHAANEYATIEVGAQHLPCHATAIGGNIDVECAANVDGTLIVRENSWTGWFVSRDGQSVELGTGPWLSTSAPAGTHHYEFRYRPWDVALGLILSLVGVGLVIRLWIKAPRTQPD